MSCEKSCEKSCEESCEESCVLEGHVHRYDPSGWLELGGFRYGDGEMVDQNALVYIFGSSASETDLFHESLLGSFIAITEAHPVRLWGSLAGFCTGIRSTISMSPHMRRKRSRRLPGEFRALCGELYSSSLFREQCVMFRLWAATSCGRVRSAVPPSWPQPEDGAIGQVLSAVLIRADQSLFRMPAEALRAASTSDFLFYAIKAGHDEDWLCSQLPEVMNCRHVLKVAGRMCKRNGGGCANAVDCRASLGLCGRQNATMDLVFASCVIGSVTAIDPAGTRLTLSDRSGAVLSVYVTGGRAAHPVGSRHVMAVVSDPCLLVEEKVGFPPIILLLCPADRIKFVTCESPVEGKVGHLLCQPSTELVTASYLSASALTVRRALAATAGPTPTWGSNVVGVVVFKELVLSNLSHHAAGRVAPQHAAGSKFLVVMRDKDYADCISAFVEAGAAADAVIGSVICIQNCNIRMSKTQKNLYIEFDRNKGSSLDLLSLHLICDGSKLCKFEACCAAFRARDVPSSSADRWIMQLTELQLIDSLSISAQHLTVCRHLPPPRILLHQFEEMAAASKGTSRCLWTCRGSISQIVSIQAFLRCGKCMSKVDPVFSSAKTAEYGSVPLRCAKCLHDIVNTVWQMSLYFDDGTGECRLSVDGEMVFELLSALLANGCVSDTRRMVESALHQIGAVRAYAFEKKNVAAADRAMSLEEPFEEEMRCLLLLRSAEEFSGEETVTKENLALKCKAVMLELIKSFRAPSDVTLQVRQIPASAQVAFGSMQFDNLESRKIKVQRSGTPAWSVETVEPVVMFQPKLRLELVSFSIFLEEKMHSACWEMLKA